jgi:Transglycosylase SLT domain
MLLPKLLLGTLVSISLTAPWLISTQADTSTAESPKAEIKTAVRGPIVAISPMMDYDEQYYIQEEQRAIAAYYAALEEQRKIDEYLAAVEAERVRQAELARTQSQSNRAPALITSGGTTVGECTGFSIPAYIIQRESGGNPNAMNPSGAYGCAQTLLSHYSSGSCRGLDPHTIEGQRACVDILSNGGTNLAPWAQTR